MRSNPFALWLYIWWFLRRAKVFQWDGSGNSDRHGWTPVDFDWLSRIPSDKWIPSESIEQYFCLLWCSSDFRYSFASWLPVISLPLEGVRNRILPIQLKKKKVFHRNLSVCIGHIWRFSFIFPIACYRLRIGTRQLFLRHACKVCRQQLTSHMNYLWKVVRSTSHILLTLSRLAKTNPWPVSSAGHRNAREVLSYLSSSEDLIIRKIIVALFKFCSEFF